MVAEPGEEEQKQEIERMELNTSYYQLTSTLCNQIFLQKMCDMYEHDESGIFANRQKHTLEQFRYFHSPILREPARKMRFLQDRL